MFGLTGSVKTVSKVLVVSMNIGPYMAYILYIYIFEILYAKKKGGFGVQNFDVMSLHWFLVILALKMAEFFKLEHFLRPFIKTRSHDGSAHTFRSSHQFLEVPQIAFFNKLISWHFLIGTTKTQFKILKFGIVVNWHKYIFL